MLWGVPEIVVLVNLQASSALLGKDARSGISRGVKKEPSVHRYGISHQRRLCKLGLLVPLGLTEPMLV